MREEKDYSCVTLTHRVRDSAALENIKAEFVEPLLAELEMVFPGYAVAHPVEKFLAIMRENSKFAPHGYSLPLDFGEGNGEITCSGLVFSGDEELAYDRLLVGDAQDGALVYSEKFPQLRDELFGTVRMDRLEDSPPNDFDERLADYRDDYAKLPVAFKIGVVAQLVSQTVLTPYSEACKFAAGWVETIETRRFLFRRRESKDFGLGGWLIAIRDQKPENELMRYLARELRSQPQISPEKAYLMHLFSERPAYTKGQGRGHKERTRHEQTEALVEFIEYILPSRGYHVGRTGEGERISFETAYKLFSEEYPMFYYNSVDSFRNAYYHAKKAREFPKEGE